MFYSEFSLNITKLIIRNPIYFGASKNLDWFVYIFQKYNVWKMSFKFHWKIRTIDKVVRLEWKL